MSARWPMVRLGDVLRRSEETVNLDPAGQYQELTVKLWGKGVVARGSITGGEVASSRRFVARGGQFVLSRIDARNGALGIVPSSLDGAILTNDFPTFAVEQGRLDCEFLGWLTRTETFVELCRKASEGTTNRVRLQETRFLSLEIPLPPLPEQRRIVARIEELAAEIHAARGLRGEAVDQADALAKSLLTALCPQGARSRPLGDLIAPGNKISYGVLVPGPDVEQGVPFVRIQDLALKNSAEKPNKRISRDVEAQYQRTRLVGGEILIGVVGSIGKVGIAPDSWAGANIARAVCRIAAGPEIDRDYLALVLSAQPCQDYFREVTRTLAQPTLNVAQLAKVSIPFPCLPEQRRIVAELESLQTEVNSLKRLQTETAAELDALLPAILDRAFRGQL